MEAPTTTGYDVIDSIKAMHEGKAKVFIALGGNLFSAAPDTMYTKRAFEKTELTAHISTKLNRSHLVCGQEALILPCLGRTDQDIRAGAKQFLSTENSMGVVQKTSGVLKPIAATMMSEPAIVAHLAAATLGNSFPINWLAFADNYNLIRDEIAATIKGFEAYNQKLEHDGGFYLPNGVKERKFETATGKANFTVNNWVGLQLAEDELVLMTIRSHDQFNTTIYGLNDRYRGIFNERRVVFINKKDMQRFEIADYEKIDLINDTGGVQRVGEAFIAIPYDIPAGNIAAYFPEANMVVPISEMASESQTPVSKSVIVKIRKSQLV